MGLFNYVGGFKQKLDGAINGMMVQMGSQAADYARSIVHVDTGQTQRSIGFTYDQATRTLTLHADTSWALYLELRYPYLRPALLSLRGFRLGAANFAMAFNTTTGQAPTQEALDRAGSRVNRGVVRRTRVRVRQYSPARVTGDRD